MASLDTSIVALIGGVTTAKEWLRPNSGMCENLREDESKSPLLNPPPNVINLDSEDTIM